ncbi:hypothetical protein Chor_004523, partial [Crotalus horridus]
VALLDLLSDFFPPFRLQIEESSKPVSWTMQLDKAVTTNYKPVANHQYNIEYDKKKKEDGKRARAEKQQVLDMLFSAFEKHQYYNIKDLVDITKQPVKGKKIGEYRCSSREPMWEGFDGASKGWRKRELNLSAFFQIYLKEILREIGIYNFKGPHKSTWELKPEYRHYQNEDKSD